MTRLEAKVAQVLLDEIRDTLHERVTALAAIIEEEIKQAKTDYLAEICRQIKHEHGMEAEADKLWELLKQPSPGAS